MLKNLAKSRKMIFVSMITAAIGLVIYILTSTTGYLKGSSFDVEPIILTLIAIILAFVLLSMKDKISPNLQDILIIISGVFLILSFGYFVVGRINLVADVHFIPVNYPVAEEVTLNISLIGIAFYLVSVITIIIAAFSYDHIK